MSNTVSDRVLLQEAIVAAWAKEGRDVSMQFTLAGIAADVAMAALSARVAKLEAEQSEARNRAARLEAALRPFAAMDFAGSIYAEYVADGDTPESVAVLCAYANGEPTGVNVTMADFSKARAALEEPCKGDSPEAAEEDKP